MVSGHEGDSKDVTWAAEAGSPAPVDEAHEIRATARLAAALSSRPQRRKGYRPSFESLIRAGGNAPALFPIPGAAITQTAKVKHEPAPPARPHADSPAPAAATRPSLGRRVLPSALSALAAVCVTVAVMRIQSPQPPSPIAENAPHAAPPAAPAPGSASAPAPAAAPAVAPVAVA